MNKYRRFAMRAAFSLLEVLIAIAILALLIALLLPAIQKVRSAAVRLQGANKLRQISLATHNYESAHGILPFFRDRTDTDNFASVHGSPLQCAMTFGGYYKDYDDNKLWTKGYVNALFQHPADPSYADPRGDTSFVANATVFRRGVTLTRGIADGLSHTIGWAEQYATCGGHGFWSNDSYPCTPLIVYTDGPYKGLTVYGGSRRHSFADRACGDTFPETINGKARPSSIYPEITVQTFNVRPLVRDCNPYSPTAMDTAGLTVAMMDSSVRTIRPGVAPEVFWALVTPSGGEVVEDW